MAEVQVVVEPYVENHVQLGIKATYAALEEVQHVHEV